MAGPSSTAKPPTAPIRTPDGRYIVHVGRAGPRLWRAANPSLDPVTRERLQQQLGRARSAVRTARNDPAALVSARAAVDAAKRALGERGAVWWTDDAPDLNRHLVRNTPYADWWDKRES